MPDKNTPGLTEADSKVNNEARTQKAHELLQALIQEAESCDAYGDGAVKLHFEGGRLLLVRVSREFTFK